MSWKGFKRGLRAVMSEPDYLRKMTPEQRAERSRQSDRRQMFAILMFDPPVPRPYKGAKSHHLTPTTTHADGGYRILPDS